MPDNNDARVTNAILGVKMEHLATKMDKSIDKLDKHMERSAEVEKCIAVLKSDYENLDGKVDNMDDRYKKINIATSLGAAIAFVLAALGLRLD